MLPQVLAAVNRRVEWVANGNHLLGTRMGDLDPAYRYVLERRFGYKIYYRIEGEPPQAIAVFAIRHGRQRPLADPSLAKFAET